MFNLFGEMQEEIDSRIDLTPLIDVVFMLIIFFVLAGTFSKPVLEVLLPHAQTSERPGGIQEKELTVALDHEGRIFAEGREFQRDELPALVALYPDLPMNLHVDKRAPFEPFIALVDQTRIAGRTNVVISTEK